MTLTSIGDLARSLVLRTRTAALKAENDRLTAELGSGRTSDVAGRLGGDMSILLDMDGRLSRLDAYDLAVNEAAVMADAMQAGLERMRKDASDLGTTLVRITEASLPQERAQAVAQARDALEAAVSVLNGRVAGRSLFAGAATDQQALAGTGELLTALKAALAGLTQWQDVIAAADQWFADPDGFGAAVYGGSANALAPFAVGDGEELAFAPRADDAAFRAVLRDMALAALAGDPDLGFDAGTQGLLLRQAGERILTDHGALTELAADIGHAQSRLDDARARNGAARAGLEYSRNELLAADPYETATRLKDVQFQLESLYTVTVRSAQLSLVNFLK